MEPGQTVLIHSGAGAVGLAAIRICLCRGCEVRSFLDLCFWKHCMQACGMLLSHSINAMYSVVQGSELAAYRSFGED